MDFDLIVIGSGPAGEKGAAQAAYFGKRVALIERQALVGGAKVHSCALPAKSLRETALFLSGARQRELYSAQWTVEAGVSVAGLMCRKDPVVQHEVQRVVRNLARHRVALFTGRASFVDPHTVRVTPAAGGAGDAGAPREITGGVVLVASGSSPYRPPDIPFDDPDVHDSDEILELERLPRSLAIIGGGVIGCEYASMFAPLGVRVTLVDRGDRLLPFADGEISALLLTSFRRLGIDVRLATKVDRVAREQAGIAVELSGGGKVVVEQALTCAGRVGNTGGLDLAAAGLAAGERGRIAVNQHYQTAVPHIYAAGDVIGFPALASTSMEQARLAMCHAFDLKYKTSLSPVLPLGVYTIPELSMVGDSEEAARKKGLDVEVGRAWYRENARGLLSGDTDGMLKLVFERGTRRLLGAHVIGERATEVVHVASTALQLGGTIDTFIDAVYNFPTLCELYKYAAYDGLGRAGVVY